MFWNKKKEVIPQIKVLCGVDKNLLECSSVSKLRNFQQELKLIENINLRELISKYFNIINDSYLRSEIYSVEAIIESLIHRCNTNTYVNYEERFKAFGEEIDAYVQRVSTINKLNNDIKLEKEKLGLL